MCNAMIDSNVQQQGCPCKVAAWLGQRLTSLSVPRYPQSWVSATFYAHHYYIFPWVVHT